MVPDLARSVRILKSFRDDVICNTLHTDSDGVISLCKKARLDPGTEETACVISL